MSARKQQRGLHPAFAVVGLLVSAGIAAASLKATLWPQRAGGGAANNQAVAMPVAPASAGEHPTMKWRDLLVVHGSFDRASDVQMVFARADHIGELAAAPVGETGPSAAEGWQGEDPPKLRLGVVMISAASRRAVLGGRVVGVGDAVGQGEVAVIEAGAVTLQWNGRRLTYDLGGDSPREFREEQARRTAMAAKAQAKEQGR